jgi:hypothetical protein
MLVSLSCAWCGCRYSAIAGAAARGRKDSSSSEEKEAKRLFPLGAREAWRCRCEREKVFWFFFSKKNRLLAFLA